MAERDNRSLVAEVRRVRLLQGASAAGRGCYGARLLWSLACSHHTHAPRFSSPMKNSGGRAEGGAQRVRTVSDALDSVVGPVIQRSRLPEGPFELLLREGSTLFSFVSNIFFSFPRPSSARV